MDYINRRHFYLQSLTDGLSLAADGEGLILDYRPNEFYEGTLSDAMRDEDDDPGWKLTYDRFSAMTLSVFMFELVTAGLLATRGNGDSVDYRLTLRAVLGRERRRGAAGEASRLPSGVGYGSRAGVGGAGCAVR
ncbi:hypothetical protein [Micromonospora peucetia]|uniref:Uncharacterized protein n=1 Tax=Micromonospora peucetia TaxID=47871 RepID=A0A1C6W6E0_9ACTN|nr:hypothetical protein [Micromonospora peucetia]SCL74135.1 hypothetical protein GA0070608_6460 [Micromonospora peucetia]